jgi:hypothetical protein
MVAVQAPIEKTRTYTPVVQRARLSVPRGLGRRQYQRVRVNDLSSLWPEGQLRTVILRNAQKFVEDLGKQGYQLLSAEADVTVTGPYQHREFTTSGLQPVERHVRRGPASNRQSVTVAGLQARGRTLGAEADSDWEDYILEARFLNSRVVRFEHAVKGPAGE